MLHFGPADNQYTLAFSFCLVWECHHYKPDGKSIPGTTSVRLDLRQRSTDWVAADSISVWFRDEDIEGADNYFKELCESDCADFDKKYNPDDDSDG